MEALSHIAKNKPHTESLTAYEWPSLNFSTNPRFKMLSFVVLKLVKYEFMCFQLFLQLQVLSNI